MADYAEMSKEELEKLAAKYEHEGFKIMKELIKREPIKKTADTLEHPDMKLTEEDV
ncbi:hypothetical protein [Aneurinibacillus migulanus]|uniref:Uncharacterized protein n=1 Tax=Aneurinibacillus migulanus TaxID=47500 RepID=A0A1G8MY40_ANEMI|nr:hypothetical protein [Aneurinibacillus migulanus]MCP1357926.1 hypothetical protein [Aneurinibacillus migulanus]MED0894600.1 hypothetical protein [Aneurinibacillus migulanus]MED1616296.1 hypothetical protein [Aneurinibacillus migulanus]SDI72786.1 hypothetical protein SAMN04487909_10717 [Aneurinibacillus migulanus]GED17123.1 hypothetical protein AMI01nite_51140 [Aneurinibacillus migulanus]